MISQSELQKLFKYNKETGDFIRKVKTAIATSVGEKAGYKNKQGYVQMRIQGKTYQAHALAWLYMFGEIPTLIDHIDGNRSNNAITNLRIADRSINGFNREKKSESSSVFKGVLWSKRLQKWFVQIKVDGKQKYCGSYSSIEEAIRVAKEMRRQYHAEFARS